MQTFTHYRLLFTSRIVDFGPPILARFDFPRKEYTKFQAFW